MLRFISERFPVSRLNFDSLLRDKHVPIHKMTWGYYTGGLALFFFIVQVITGLLLLLYYQATVSGAFVSVKLITEYVPGGALIRNMHTWSSSMMIFVCLVHLLTTFAMKAFEKPREITWIAGVLLLLLTFAFGFTGYLLPWNQLSVNATKVLLQSIDQIGAYLPGILADAPSLIKQVLQGGQNIGQETLSRFFALHVVFLPAAFLTVLSLHLLSIQIHGMSQGVAAPASRTEKFFPLFLYRDISVWTIGFFILLVLAMCLPFEAFVPYPLLEPFNQFGATPVGIKPEWYFYFIYYPLELLPFGLVALLLSVAVVVLFLTPWIFRRANRRLLSAIAIVCGLYMTVMTAFGQNIYNYLKGGMVLGLLLFVAGSPAFAYPPFQRFSQEHSGKPVDCSMCHVNPQGPSGDQEGQLLSLTAEELQRVNVARDADAPGVDVNSPIMNKFGNHIIKTLGMNKVNEAIGNPEILAKALGDKSDLDGDGISDSREFLDGTNPLNKRSGDPNLLFWINLGRMKFEVLFVAVSLGFMLFGLSKLIKDQQETLS